MDHLEFVVDGSNSERVTKRDRSFGQRSEITSVADGKLKEHSGDVSFLSFV
ncbi:MAG: hypothetical protein AAGF85_20595 [Bacteroidota bacterium]